MAEIDPQQAQRNARYLKAILPAIEEMHGTAAPERCIKVSIPWWAALPAPQVVFQVVIEPKDLPVLREFHREFPRLLELIRAHPDCGLSPRFLATLTLLQEQAQAIHNRLISPPPPPVKD